jgi:hypothetical protein
MSFAPALGAAHFSEIASLCATLMRHFLFCIRLACPIFSLPCRVKPGAPAGPLVFRVGPTQRRLTPRCRTGFAAVRITPVAPAADDLQPSTTDAGKLPRVLVGLSADWSPRAPLLKILLQPICMRTTVHHAQPGSPGVGVCERPRISWQASVSSALLFAWANSRLRPLDRASNNSTRPTARWIRPSHDLARASRGQIPPRARNPADADDR